MNKVILSVFLVLCIVALSISSPLEEREVVSKGSPASLSLTPEEASLPLGGEDDHDADQQREKRQFFGTFFTLIHKINLIVQQLTIYFML